MNFTAYLVCQFSIVPTGAFSVPVFKSIGIFSEPQPTVFKPSLQTIQTVLLERSGASYAEAERFLVETVQADPGFAWVMPHLAHQQRCRGRL